MNQSAAIAGSITSLWRTVAALSALVPGGLLYGDKAKAPTTKPYALLTVEMEGRARFDSGGSYLQRYGVEIRVWSNAALGTAGAIQAALETLLGRDTKLVLAGTAATLSCMIEPSGITEEAERSYAANVFVAGGRWNILVVEDKLLASAGHF